MKRFSLIVLALVLAASSLHAQQSYQRKLEAPVGGGTLVYDGNGNYFYNVGDQIHVKGTYDVKTNDVMTKLYCDEKGAPLNGKRTVCTVKSRNNDETPYVSSYEGNGYNVSVKVYNDPANSKKDYVNVCGSYSEIEQTTYVDGIKEGPYSYYQRSHGGNVDGLETVKGSYRNNQKDGEWVEVTEMDCAGTLDTWFEWINGSYRRITKTTYSNGEVVSGPTVIEE